MFPLNLLAGNIPLYAAGAGLVAVGVFAGVQTVRLDKAQTALATEQRDRAIEHSQLADAARKQTERFRTTELDWQKAQHANELTADKARAQAAADALAAGAASGRLRDRALALAASCRGPAANSSAVPAGHAASSPGILFAELLSRLDAAGQLVSTYADAAAIASEQCAADYSALSAPPTPE